MKVAVVGAGVIGVTTAWELAADGHEVTVFERRGSVGAETSFANAGVVAPGYVTPWAAPGMPAKVLRHLFARHAPVRVRSLAPATLEWMWRWWRACAASTYQSNRLCMQRLALASRERLHSLTQELALDYERSQGYLVLLRGKAELTQVRSGLKVLTELGTRFHVVDAAECRRIEPGLKKDTPLLAGVHLPDDEVGNCRQFTLLLRNAAQQHGVDFRFHSEVAAILPGRQPQLTIRTLAPPDTALPPTQPGERETVEESMGTEAFDAVVVCAAIGSRALLRPLGLKIPMVPVHGYSLTLPMPHHESHPEASPRSGVMDERFKVAISRLGNRLRVAGSAELGGSAHAYYGPALDTLYKVLDDWFPGVGAVKQAQRWKGARPMLPDGPPVIGASGSEGIWLNLGHGSSGWALACGSASLLADALKGQSMPQELERLSPARLR